MTQTIALVGNPNAGKTSLFNILTGTRQYVGNWAGVTVERKEGWVKGDKKWKMVDLPGIYSLSAQTLEEKIALSFILGDEPDVLLNIIDASNLERNLYFTVQLLETGLPAIVSLNMIDVAEGRGLTIDKDYLEKALGVPVVPMVARKGKGKSTLLKRFDNGARRASLKISYPDNIEQGLASLLPLLNEAGWTSTIDTRWLALMWLEGNESVSTMVNEKTERTILEKMNEIRKAIPSADNQIRQARYEWVERILSESVSKEREESKTWSDRVDSVLLHPLLGLPLFFMFMYLIFQITFSWVGMAGSDLLDGWLSGPISEGIQKALVVMDSPAWFTRLMIEGVVAGMGAVLVFVPQIAILFLCLSFLEDSGYMSRAAVLMDRFLRGIGLNGKAFIPLVLGFGCNVPAIMATRTLEDEKSRLLTALISPFMSCSARLSVYALFVSAFFSAWQAEIVFLLYVFGILMAILTAFILNRFIDTEDELFVMELPPYRTPMVVSLLLHTWDKSKGFVKKAGTIIFGMSVLLWFLGQYSWQGAVPMEDSFLASIGGWVAPVFAPMGFDTWQSGVALITGFLAKEVVVATMGVAYGAGTSVGTLASLLPNTFTPAAAISFLFFVLLYTPCVSTVMVLKKETGSWKWMTFSIVYSFVLAWIVAWIVYVIASWVL
ncbi:ferrous iron transport protein B [Marininema halotolerans]|uniref:Ferrous iron transport protein B n=1 Tax=Marininema halotolerans TaxID=1155944 RepID=A0A1I6QEE2_9BACL|nr:ferrous iron transport protein B [Marininema halotolerans]SFS50648.1 ferrous iron transport protein B [Marininema halotolerans]